MRRQPLRVCKLLEIKSSYSLWISPHCHFRKGYSQLTQVRRRKKKPWRPDLQINERKNMLQLLLSSAQKRWK